MVLTGQYCPESLHSAISQQAREEALEAIIHWPNYQRTDLLELSDLADELGIAALYYKDESSRFELASFKALGGAYAVQLVLRRSISRELGQEVTLEDIEKVRYPEIAGRFTVVTATDGNHGRSVAWGAQRFGCQCVIYMHEQVSKGRQQAVELFGAKVRRVKGNYDDSVHAAAVDATSQNWLIVSDTAWPGYLEVPRTVMAGYTVMTHEVMAQWPLQSPPTHVFIQGGCGGLAAAVCLDMWCHYGSCRPIFLIVEPEAAACLYESVQACERRSVNIERESVMAGLSCGEVSLVAWPILKLAADEFLTITDEPVAPLMRRLARDHSIIAGESAVAGLAGLTEARLNEVLWQQLALTEKSRVLVFGTEGATDPDIYQHLVQSS